MRDHKYNFNFYVRISNKIKEKKNVLQVHVHVPDLLTSHVS